MGVKTKQEKSKYASRWAKNHPEHVKRYVDNRRIRYRKIIDSIKSEKGCSCGEHDPRCLDFHHIKGRKEFTIAESLPNYGIDRVLAEIAKCEVMCANCHRKKHHDLRTRKLV